MNVLFLALGASRKRAVVEESTQVVADGGTASIMVSARKPWRRSPLLEDVEVIDSAAVWRGHRPMAIEHLLLYRGPRFVLYRILARGPIRRPVRKLARGYERRIADRIHRRLFLPLYLRFYRGVREDLIARKIRDSGPFDWIIVADPSSMPEAQWLLERIDGPDRPGVAYSIDHLPVGAPR
jgi:hypothetical protein